jgi:dTDP-4-dehydrorhamnose 3,5-epimerase
MPFQFHPDPTIPDIVVVVPQVMGDARGWFLESYKLSEFGPHGIGPFVQDNHSRSATRGILRGLHYQLPPFGQGKLVRCVAGEIYDVAVDIRRASPTYGKAVGETLTAENRRMLWVPAGFAHGFLTLTDGAEVQYKVTAEYSRPHERAVAWNDPALAIAWPIKQPSLLPRDAAAPPLSQAENPFRLRGGV